MTAAQARSNLSAGMEQCPIGVEARMAADSISPQMHTDIHRWTPMESVEPFAARCEVVLRNGTGNEAQLRERGVTKCNFVTRESTCYGVRVRRTAILAVGAYGLEARAT